MKPLALHIEFSDRLPAKAQRWVITPGRPV